ncbi:hypothetical protein [Pectinatus haikarae]|uniref:Uncharacterized protein n=1 Tax=Pectinatus haikarae TaxID=349096 RepID=A0ABT9Y992_9FIRM|nr:hypothetical protein [Pectinatus haikarae]MDQ0204060.1 hypothetical protein [Pectinatus haikarae]
MSQELFQLENGQISIAKNNIDYIDTLENFKLDYANCPSFSHEFVLYNRTLEQYVLDSEIQAYTAQSNLDTCIDSVQTIIDAQKKRNPDTTDTSTATNPTST